MFDLGLNKGEKIMCTVSMIMQHYDDKWSKYIEDAAKIYEPTVTISYPTITPEEIAEFRELLERARQYDIRHNQPNCELESKKKKVRDLADMLGVKVDFLD